MIAALRGIRLATFAMVCALAGINAARAAAPDAGLFTSYTVSTNLQSASWFVCGATLQTEGCYSFGTLGPFGRIGAMLESHPAVKGQTVTRQIYVLDVASGSAGNGVTLFVYTKQDVISDTTAVSTMKLKSTIVLPLVGGATATASMAANNAFIYVGTSLSTQAASVARSNGAVTTLGGFSPPAPVASITADSYGYVTVTFGAPGNEVSGFYVFGPTGAYQEDGGGAEFMLDASNAVIPVPLPP